MELNCASCSVPLIDGEPHCSQCEAAMTCDAETCTCECGNTVAASDVKCDACLAVTA